MAKKKAAKSKTEKSSEKKDGAETQRIWEERIVAAKKAKEDWSQLFRVELARDYFDGRQNPGHPENEWITVNKIYSHLMAQLPTLYSMDPYFYVKTKKSHYPDPSYIATFDERAKIRQAYLNYLKAELKLKTKARLAIQDAHFAFGVVKVHFKSDEKENPDAGNEILGEDGKPLLDDSGEALLEPDIIPINERYVLSRLHPDDFIWSSDAGSLDDKWHWVAERICMTRAEAEADKRLNQTILRTVRPSERAEDRKTLDVFDRKYSDPSEEILTFWEIYDLDKKRWLMIAEGADEPLIEPDELPRGVERHPYAVLRFTLRDKSPYPIPPVSQAIDPQREYCTLRSQIMVHRKRFNRKYEVNVNALAGDADDEISKLENGEDGTCIKTQVTGAVTAIQDAPLDQMRMAEVGFLDRDMTEIFGSAGESRGIVDAQSATQADIMDKRLQIKEGDKLSIVTDWITEIGEKLDKLVQANISRDEAVRIIGPQGEFWQLVRVDDYAELNGEFEYSVNVGSTFPQLPQIERAQWLSFLQVLVQFPHLLMQKHLMKRMAEMHHIEDEAMLEELYTLGRQIMGGQLPMPGAKGSQPGVPMAMPGAVTGGMAGGPLGGNANGGGAPGGMMNA